MAGRILFPGAAYVEFIRTSVLSISDEIHIIAIKNILWNKPIVFDQERIEIIISLHIKEDTVHFKFLPASSGHSEIIYCQGLVQVSFESNFENIPQNIHIKKQIDIATNEISHETIYSRLAGNGAGFGDSFRNLKKLFVNADFGIAELAISDEAMQTASSFYLHPSILDSLFQTAMSHFYADENNAGIATLPYAVKEIKIFNSIQNATYVYARKLLTSNDKIIIYDVFILDSDGNVLVSFEGCSFKSIEAVSLDQTDKYYATLKMVESYNDIGDMQLDEKEVLLVFITESMQEYPLVKQLKERFLEESVFFVFAGSGFQSLSENRFEINIQNAEDYQQLFQYLDAMKLVPAYIIHMLYSENTEVEFSRILDFSIYSVFNISKGLMEVELL